MSDVALMGTILGLVLGGIAIILFIWQKIDHKKSTQDLKMFQMENAQLIRQMEKESLRRHEENDRFFKGLSYSVGQIYLKLDLDENGKN